MPSSEFFLLVGFIMMPPIVVGATRLSCLVSGWSKLARSESPLVGAEAHRFCTVSMSRGHVLIDFRSGTNVRRLGPLVEMRLVFTPSWLAPPVLVDATTCSLVDEGRYLTLREPKSGVLIRTFGRSRRAFERARAASIPAPEPASPYR